MRDISKKELPQARIWKAQEVAARLNRPVSWLYQNHRRLRQLGFPARDKLLGGWDAAGCEAWLDARATLRKPAGTEAAMIEAIHGPA